MTESQVEPINLFSDVLTLVYHEARHVRFLIEAGYIMPEGWDRIVSLPRNRIEGWRTLQPVRQASRRKSTAFEVTRLFEKRFGQSLGSWRCSTVILTGDTPKLLEDM